MADSKESFEILENASGDGVSPTASESGFTATGKIGMTVFGFKDGSGNLILPSTTVNGIKTDGSAVTQPVSGTVTANAGTNLNTSALALEATLSALNAKVTNLTTAPTSTENGIVVRVVATEYPTFSVVSTLTAVANNKSMLAIQNIGTSVVRIREIWIINDRTTAVTGVAGIFEARRIASFSGGTALTPVSFDTADSLPSGITCATGSTVATETSLLRTGTWSTDEWGPGTSDTESFDHAIQNTEPFWRQTPQGKAMTIRQNEGLHVKFATNSTAGEFNIRLVFTTE